MTIENRSPRHGERRRYAVKEHLLGPIMGIKLDNVPPLFLVASLVVAFAGRLFFDYSLADALFYGSVVGFAPLGIFALLCIVISVFFGGFNNDRPPCDCGNCRSNDYQYMNHDSNGYRYRCPACGKECVVHGKVFFVVTPSGELLPTKKQTKWGRWALIQE